MSFTVSVDIIWSSTGEQQRHRDRIAGRLLLHQLRVLFVAGRVLLVAGLHLRGGGLIVAGLDGLQRFHVIGFRGAGIDDHLHAQHFHVKGFGCVRHWTVLSSVFAAPVTGSRRTVIRGVG